MKVLVTGSNGFLGRAVVERLLAHGVQDVRCFIRSDRGRAQLESLEKAYPDARIEFFRGTLATVEGAAQALEGVNLVYHIAASLKGAPADIFLNTVVASKNLLEALIRQERPPKVVLVSSFGVYGTAALPPKSVVNENTPLETHPEKRDVYSYSKLRQEQLFWEYREKRPFPLAVVRPGVIYGPGGGAFSSRVGLQIGGVFLHLGGNNALPLSYVENCAEAVVVAGLKPETDGEVFNVHDDDLPTCKQYLRAYRRKVKKIKAVRLPYRATMALSRWMERYHRRSRGQLPAVFTPYKTATSWKSARFDNSKLKRLGWKQIVSTDEGLKRNFEALRSQG
jgi:nucleoside-diphosphate-sugar epimerase